MRLIVAIALFVAAGFGLYACFAKKIEKPRVLVFSATKGFRHSSIGVGKLALLKLGTEHNFTVDTTEDASAFNEDNLKKYAAVVFLNTTGDVLNNTQQNDFERYIQAGGGFLGVHAAADCEYTWPWYGKLVGAYFKSHPATQKAKLIVKDKSNLATKHLPDVWERTDEWYNFKTPPTELEVKVLIAIDESSYEGGENGAYHPMAWYHEYDGGRAFYTEFGHTDESYADPNYLQHLLGGLVYAIGDGKALDYSKATTLRLPEPDRFSKNIVATGYDEPTEMAILPNLDVLVVQRKGQIHWYNKATGKNTQVAKMNVYHKTTVPGVNAEEGVMGITADPNFAKNNFVYVFYSPMDSSVNRLSRFVFKDGKFDLKSEKVILQFYSQRNICCHTGGSLSFGPDRTLFLSTGDNTTPFDQNNSKYQLNGYGPIDGRAGYEQWDARRSSSNTNDLRGKVLRIKVAEDGTYAIPEGNLFPKGTDKARPEIYVMGNRNPYRISIDRKTGFLYWGEVGPDAGADSANKGPRGYDELNQARKAGYFGWPLFVGKNYAYRNFNYATGEASAPFDAAKPVNDSKNNTGLSALPPVSPPFIWYPYAASEEFPELGTGGRNAMAGPVYHPEFYPKETRFPEYYAGKLFFYDWIRGWVKAVTTDAEGNYVRMEPVLQNIKFNSPIDMEMGPDGRLYVLEYGNGWFTKNPDAGLVRIDFNSGNRKPISAFKVDKTSGALPMTVNVSAEGSGDPDNDKLTYIWHYGSKTKTTTEPQTTLQLTAAGDYNMYVEVKDDKGASTKSSNVNVYAGNEAPKVSIQLENGNTYIPGQPVKYKVLVNDKEDGTKIDPANVFVKVDYISGMDKAQVVGHQQVSAALEGKALVESSDCKTCHKLNEKSIGPAYTAVSKKYASNPKATDYLVGKIIKGGGGVWGETAMPAHPDLKAGDANKIVNWILGLSKPQAKSLPAQGSITPSAKDVDGGKTMQITASYTDKGGAGRKPQTGVEAVFLSGPVLTPASIVQKQDINVMEFGGRQFMMATGASGWMAFQVDLSGIKSLEFGYSGQGKVTKGVRLEVFAEEVTGKKIGEVLIDKMVAMQDNRVTMEVPTGTKTKRFVVKISKVEGEEATVVLTAVSLK
ncbi:MAG: PKD domain-containing protein [Sphingobacteriales bacterium]|nr:MAG: PKD domain-containing protein [Sphingobacteriales bacterium]